MNDVVVGWKQKKKQKEKELQKILLGFKHKLAAVSDISTHSLADWLTDSLIRLPLIINNIGQQNILINIIILQPGMEKSPI